jgi:hypothetical protein
MIVVYGTAQRIGPEPGRFIDIRCVAVNQKRAKTGVVHGWSPFFDRKYAYAPG